MWPNILLYHLLRAQADAPAWLDCSNQFLSTRTPPFEFVDSNCSCGEWKFGMSPVYTTFNGSHTGDKNMLPISTASLLHDNVIPNPYIKEYPHLATATDKLAATHLYSEYVEATNLLGCVTWLLWCARERGGAGTVPIRSMLESLALFSGHAMRGKKSLLFAVSRDWIRFFFFYVLPNCERTGFRQVVGMHFEWRLLQP